MNIERPGSPSATIVAPTSKRRSTSIETKKSRLASERPPKKGVASKNAFRSGELTAIDLIYSRSQRRQAGHARRNVSTINTCAGGRAATYTILVTGVQRMNREGRDISAPASVHVTRRHKRLMISRSHMIGHGQVHMHCGFVVVAAVGGPVGQHAVVLNLEGHAGGQFADFFGGAINRHGVRLDVACLHQVAIHGRLAAVFLAGAAATRHMPPSAKMDVVVFFPQIY